RARTAPAPATGPASRRRLRVIRGSPIEARLRRRASVRAGSPGPASHRFARVEEPTLDPEREQVADACRRLAAAGLVVGTAGNVSARSGDLVAISPTGAALADVRADQVSVVDLDGRLVGAALQ